MTIRLPALDPLALEDLHALDDDGTFVQEIIALFRSETPARVDAVRGACARGDADGMASEAHALKSSAAQLGARALSDVCRRIEGHARAGEIALASALADDLARAASEADEALADVSRPGA